MPTNDDEANGMKYCLLIKISTDAGIVGWSDVETAPSVAAAVVNAPSTNRFRMNEKCLFDITPRSLLVGKSK